MRYRGLPYHSGAPKRLSPLFAASAGLELMCPHQHNPASLQMSRVDRQMAAFSSKKAGNMSCRVKERNHTVRSAQTMPAQSSGITSCNGFAFQTCSIDCSSGSSEWCSVNCFAPCEGKSPAPRCGGCHQDWNSFAHCSAVSKPDCIQLLQILGNTLAARAGKSSFSPSLAPA